MAQEIRKLNIRELVLWTENPRDPIDTNATDQEVADRAINQDSRKKWSLKKLFESMGNHYDLSELPTVAYTDNKPIVYDGNKRILIGKIIHKRVNVRDSGEYKEFDFPEMIECNVCSIELALEHVDRKHAENGNWDPLERDIFKHKYMGKEKSSFLALEENTGIISANPDLNKRFVNEEIFTPTALHEMGFSTTNGEFKSAHNNDDSEHILEKIRSLIISKTITTRKNRGSIIRLLKEDSMIKVILNKPRSVFKDFKSDKFKTKKTPITLGKTHKLFGKKLILNSGHVNNIYSDLLKLYTQKNYSEDFPMIIRMGLRLLCELAFKNWEQYLKTNFNTAKQLLSPDEKTTLHTQQVRHNNIISLLQSGAHGYTASNSIDQTVAISLVLGRLLEQAHGKK